MHLVFGIHLNLHNSKNVFLLIKCIIKQTLPSPIKPLKQTHLSSTHLAILSQFWHSFFNRLFFTVNRSLLNEDNNNF